MNMNVDELTLNARILQELGEIKAGQKHLQSDVADIKNEIREIRDTNREIEDRVRVLETVQAECRGQSKTKSSAINKATALFAAIISAVVSIVVAIIGRAE